MALVVIVEDVGMVVEGVVDHQPEGATHLDDHAPVAVTVSVTGKALDPFLATASAGTLAVVLAPPAIASMVINLIPVEDSVVKKIFKRNSPTFSLLSLSL